MRTIFLLGFMGSGKSAVARTLARRLRLPIVDLDGRIEEEIGMSIARFFQRHGEAEFRRVESKVLRAAAHLGGVVSLGGGVPTVEANRQLLKNAASNGATTVYLRASASVLAHRIRRQPGKRPLIDGEGALDFEATLARVKAMLREREKWYLECANCVIQTDELSVPGVARQIVASIESPETWKEEDWKSSAARFS